jgi:hypothetical protein
MVVDPYLRALFGEQQRTGTADTGGSTGDQNALTIEFVINHQCITSP